MKYLVQLIRDNPGAVFIVDNDCWWMLPTPPKPPEEMNGEEYDKWSDAIIAREGEVLILGDGGYGSGCRYGGDILQALAVIVGVKIESV